MIDVQRQRKDRRNELARQRRKKLRDAGIGLTDRQKENNRNGANKYYRTHIQMPKETHRKPGRKKLELTPEQINERREKRNAANRKRRRDKRSPTTRKFAVTPEEKAAKKEENRIRMLNYTRKMRKRNKEAKLALKTEEERLQEQADVLERRRERKNLRAREKYAIKMGKDPKQANPPRVKKDKVPPKEVAWQKSEKKRDTVFQTINRDYSKHTKITIDNKTEIWVRPGKDPEEVRAAYLERRAAASKF